MATKADEIKVYDDSYPTRRLLELIGDKWTPIVVYILGQGTKRYGELRRHLPDVSKKMLTQTLRALERDGLLKRKVYAEVPPRVDYDLTPLGRVFLEPVTSLCAWAQAHQGAFVGHISAEGRFGASRVPFSGLKKNRRQRHGDQTWLLSRIDSARRSTCWRISAAGKY